MKQDFKLKYAAVKTTPQVQHFTLRAVSHHTVIGPDNFNHDGE